jgi:hypothetical protein
MRTAILAIVCLALTACGAPEESPEQQIRDWIARGETAAENKDRGELLDMISAGYADARGNDRERIGDLLRAYFFRQNSIALLVDVDEITVNADTAALVNLTVGMAGTNAHAPGLRADAYNFEFELQKPGDDWLLIGARWGSLGRGLH